MCYFHAVVKIFTILGSVANRYIPVALVIYIETGLGYIMVSLTEEHNMPNNRTHRAAEFLTSWRGRLILSQALMIAIAELEQVALPHREVSNIQDMEYLLEEWGLQIEDYSEHLGRTS